MLFSSYFCILYVRFLISFSEKEKKKKERNSVGDLSGKLYLVVLKNHAGNFEETNIKKKSEQTSITVD